MKALVALLGLAAIGLVACETPLDCFGKSCRRSVNGEDDELNGKNGGDPEAAPVCTNVGKAHIGLGNEDLAAKADGVAGRARTKPYTALVTEYSRVLGSSNKPGLIDKTGGTFGEPVERWYIEPIPSAVLINTAYAVAFEGCRRLTGDATGGTADARYSKVPDAGVAATECAGWMRKAWSRDGSEAEIAACVNVAVESSKTESYGDEERETTPKRRWAYACASVLTATGFLTY